MKKLYVLQEPFYEIVQKYPCILEKLSKEQTSMLLRPLDIEELMLSAASYFQCDIVMDESMLFMKNSLTKECSSIECCSDGVLFDQETNPFVGLLKRKYRHFLIKDFDLT